MAIHYMSAEQRERELDAVTNEKPDKCPGFNFHQAELLTLVYPKDGLHYDKQAQKPITTICKHETLPGGRMSCQPYAEYLYILVQAFARECINGPQWIQLFPKRYGKEFRGFPRYAEHDSAHPNCVGFRSALAPKMTPVDPDDYKEIKLGRQIDPVTLCMVTIPCDHSKCDENVLYLYALYRAHATGLMLVSGLDIHGGFPDVYDPLVVLQTYSWLRAYRSAARDYTYKRVIAIKDLWPEGPEGQTRDYCFWDPTTLAYLHIRDDDEDGNDSDEGEPALPAALPFTNLRVNVNEYHGVGMAHLMRTMRIINGTPINTRLSFSIRRDLGRLLHGLTSQILAKSPVDARRLGNLLNHCHQQVQSSLAATASQTQETPRRPSRLARGRLHL